MPYDRLPAFSERCSRPTVLGLVLLAWLILISGLHYYLNRPATDRQVIRMGYMPVITNLAAPLLDHASRQGTGMLFEAVKFASFAEMAEALRNDSIQAAFIIAPLAVVLRQQGVDVKVVYIGNRHESTLVARKIRQARSLKDLVGGTIAVPMRYSGHNLCLLKMISEMGLDGKIRVVEMNPPDMAAALTAGALDGYFVGEPFAAQTVMREDADVVVRVESVWPNFICNLLLVKNEFIATHPTAVERLVASAARSGMWASRHPEAAARIVSKYWNQSTDLVRYALTEPAGRIVYDRFIPDAEELQLMADLMDRFRLIPHADIQGLVDDRFARAASLAGVSDLASIILP